MNDFVSLFDRMLALKGFQGFSHLTPEELTPLARQAEPRRFAKDDVLLRASQVSSSLFFLLEGSVSLRDGTRRLLTISPRAVVGGLSAFARQPTKHDLVADEALLLLELPYRSALQLLENNFSILHSVLQGMARALLRARQEVGPFTGFEEQIQPDMVLGDRPLGVFDRMRILLQSMPVEWPNVAALAELARDTTIERYPAHQQLWREGDDSGYTLVLLQGTLRCEAQGGSRTFRFGPLDFVGTSDSAAGLPRWYTATSEAPLVALRIDANKLFDVYEEYVEVPLGLLSLSSKFLMQMQEALIEQGASPIPDESPREIPLSPPSRRR